MKDSWLSSLGSTKYTFFSIFEYVSYNAPSDDFNDSEYHQNIYGGVFYTVNFHIGHHGKTYTRTAYTLSSLISDVGGLVGSLYGMAAILLAPYSYFSFVLQAAGQLFFAK